MHRRVLTSGPPDGNHDQQAVFVFAVGLRDPTEHLPGSGDFLHSWQHQPERQEGNGGVHQVHGAVKHQVPVRREVCASNHQQGALYTPITVMYLQISPADGAKAQI